MVNGQPRRKLRGKDPNIDYLMGATVLITNISEAKANLSIPPFLNFPAKVLLQSLGCCHL